MTELRKAIAWTSAALISMAIVSCEMEESDILFESQEEALVLGWVPESYSIKIGTETTSHSTSLISGMNDGKVAEVKAKKTHRVFGWYTDEVKMEVVFPDDCLPTDQIAIKGSLKRESSVRGHIYLDVSFTDGASATHKVGDWNGVKTFRYSRMRCVKKVVFRGSTSWGNKNDYYYLSLDAINTLPIAI